MNNRLWGEPDISLLRKLKSDSKRVGAEVKAGNYAAVPEFREKYQAPLKTLLENLIDINV